MTSSWWNNDTYRIEGKRDVDHVSHCDFESGCGVDRFHKFICLNRPGFSGDSPANPGRFRLPGEIVSARVQSILPGTGQGQLPPSGTLMEFTTNPVPGRFPVLLELDDSESLSLPPGASGVAAIYTSHAQKIQIIRKVVIRMTSWLNYIIR